MADIEKTPVIQFKTDDSGMLKGVTSVKELKLAISQLKDEIVKMRQAGEDTTTQTSQLQAAQRELNTVMGLTKKGVDGVEDSYDHINAQYKEQIKLVHSLAKTINGELNPEYVAAAEKARALGKELSERDASWGVHTRNVGNYKSALEGFSGVMGQAAQIGGQFNNGLQAMSNLMLMAGVNTDGMSDAMKGMQIAVGVLQGVRGFGGLIDKVLKFAKDLAKSTTATKADAQAKKADAQANLTMAGSEEVATKATNKLKIALYSIGIGVIIAAIGLLVAHIEDVANWFGKIGEKLGIVKKETKEWEDANENLTNRFEEQNRELRLQQKIYAAQGRTKKELLQQQKAQIQLQINETKATLNNIEARIKQMEADSAWVRFWKGENKKIKEAKEEAKALAETLKGLQQNMQEINIDIRVEEISGGKKNQTSAQKAAADKAKEAAEALRKAQEIIKAGTDAANKALEAQETELEKIDRLYQKDKKLIEDTVKEIQKLSGETADVSYWENSLVALRTTYYRQRFEAETAKAVEKTIQDKEHEYKIMKDHERVLTNILNINNRRYDQQINLTAAEQQQLDTLRAAQKYLRSQIELTDDVLKTLEGKSHDELAKEFGEPIATAIGLYFEKSDELKDAGFTIYERVFSTFEDGITQYLDKGEFKAARFMASAFQKQFYKELKDAGFGEEAIEYFDKVIDKMFNEAYKGFEGPGKIDLKPIGYDTELMRLEQSLETLKQYREQLYEALKPYDEDGGGVSLDLTNATDEVMEAAERYFEIERLIDATQEEIYRKRLERFSNFFGQVGKYINSYGKATGNVLESVADFWEAELQAKVKNGKMTEEQAKKSFKSVKALQISTAVINTAAAVVQALADTTVPSYYVKAANAVAAGIAGAAQIVKISSTDFSSSGSYSAGSTSAPTLTQTPQMVNTYGINPADYAEANAQNPVRVYVVESDITDAQNTAKVRVQESTF